MNKYWQKLEYDKIIAKLIDCGSFALSKEIAQGLEPKKNPERVIEAIAETSEGVEILRLYPTFTIGGARDIRETIKRARLGGTLNVGELVQVGSTCTASRQCKNFFSQIKGQFPVLIGLSKSLGLFKTIETAIEKAITPENTISDGASEKLYNIRKRMKTHQGRIQERLDNFIKNPNTARFLQEPIITIRGERFVVPVKQEYRASVAGVVHDISASGATLFVEPMAVMDANNELQKLKLQESEEIEAILRALTAVVVNFADELEASLYALGKIDFILAKAKLSNSMEGNPCKINNVGAIGLKQARHPLISGTVVPIDVSLNSNLKTMVITGPNTGGKTVTLKTIGLLTLMALAGLHIPAEYGSELSYFADVYADIGDEQSIEQSLSTFSAHMVNLVYILANAKMDSLVLMDELGSGTDPTEGAALAMAILEYLFKAKVKAVATTHYSELKSFAYNKQGFINASVEFDVETLRPTYRLLMGVPGKSNAFEISRKLGLNEVIIDRANSFLSADEQQVADLITNLEENNLKAAEARQEAEILQAQILEQQRLLRLEETTLHNKEAEIIRKAHLEAVAVVKAARAESDALYQQLKDKLKYVEGAGKEVQVARDKMKRLETKLVDKLPEDKYLGTAPLKVEVGQKVEIPKLRQRGIVLTLPDDKNEVLVQIGIMKVGVKLADLRIDKNLDEKEKTVGTNRVKMEKAKAIATEVDLRGLMVDEAMEVLDKYLDDAFLANVKQVRIIHGKGTGALRAGLTPYLKKHRLIESTRMGEYNEGGIGVTVAVLK